MAVEKYQWESQLGAGEIKYTNSVRSVQFGDGYEQVSENGINATAIEIPMMHTGGNAEVDAIRSFLMRHYVKAFQITPPGESLGLYRVVADSITKQQNSRLVSTINFTLRRAYGVYA